MKKTVALAALTASLMSTGVLAAPVAGSSLQDALNAAGAAVDVNNDQYVSDSYWLIGSSTVAVTNILFEFAGFADSTAFGIYDKDNAGSKLQVYGGVSSPGSIALIANSSVSGGRQFCTAPLFSMPTCTVFAGSQFGFYLQTQSGTFYSDSDLNGDNFDHLVAYQGNHTGSNPSYINGSPWLANEFVLAWEDLWGGGDADYDDFVVLVESVVSAPEPTTLGLFGLGLLAAGLRARKRRP